MATSRYEQFRREVRDLGIEAERDIAILWRSMTDARDAKESLFDLLPEVVAAYHGAAASLAADFYDDIRDEAGARGRFAPILDEPNSLGANELIRWALGSATDSAGFVGLIVGGVTRRISNGARDVITRSSIADPASDGWMRIGRGSCAFCAMLISRGAVYSEATVDFASHDHCNCGAAPAFNPAQIKAVKSEFVPSARRRSEETEAKDAERARDWIAANL